MAVDICRSPTRLVNKKAAFHRCGSERKSLLETPTAPLPIDLGRSHIGLSDVPRFVCRTRRTPSAV